MLGLGESSRCAMLPVGEPTDFLFGRHRQSVGAKKVFKMGCSVPSPKQRSTNRKLFPSRLSRGALDSAIVSWFRIPAIIGFELSR